MTHIPFPVAGSTQMTQILRIYADNTGTHTQYVVIPSHMVMKLNHNCKIALFL